MSVIRGQSVLTTSQINNNRFAEGTIFYDTSSDELKLVRSNNDIQDCVVNKSGATVVKTLSTAERQALSSSNSDLLPGALVYDSDLNYQMQWNGSNWVCLSPNWMRVSISSSQTVQGTLVWDESTSMNTQLSLNTSTGLISTTHDGYYKFSMNLTVFDVSAAERYVRIQIMDSDDTDVGQIHTSLPSLDSGTTYNDVSLTEIVQMSSSKTYRMEFASGNGETADIYLGSRTYIEFMHE